MLPKRRQQRLERQSQDGEIIPLDAFEKLRTTAFKPVATDALEQFLAFRDQIIVEETIAEIAHFEGRRFSRAPDRASRFGQHQGADELVTATAQTSQQSSRLIETGALVHKLALECQYLVGTEDQRVGPVFGH